MTQIPLQPQPQPGQRQNYNAINGEFEPMTLQYVVMKSSKCLKCLRVFFIIINIILFLLACCLIGLGGFGVFYLNSLFEVGVNIGIYAPVVLIIAGSFLVVISVVACCFDPKHNFCALYTYSFFQFLCTLIIVAAVTLFITQSSTIEKSFQSGFQNAVKNYTSHKPEVDAIQELLSCCGSNNYTDYFNLNAVPLLGRTYKVPTSCCAVDPSVCKTTFTNPYQINFDIFQMGCSPKLNSIVDDGAVVLALIGGGIAVFPLIASVLACCLLHVGKNSKVRLGYQRF